MLQRKSKELKQYLKVEIVGPESTNWKFGTTIFRIAGLLQATSLTFIVAASQIGLELGLISKASGAALIAAGLLSVLIFPILALTLLHRTEMTNKAEMVVASTQEIP
jgi:predicted Kef-type K+ transport protein